MSKVKKQNKADKLTYIIIGACIAFVILLIMGCIQFKATQILEAGRENSKTNIQVLKDGWTCELEDGVSFPTQLPNNLNLPSKTTKIILINQLPNTEIPGGGLRFECMSTAVNIYIDGELVKSYGKITDEKHFIYNAASNVIFIPLETSQYGKEIAIELSSIFKTELGMVIAPQLGSQHDFLLNDLLNNATNIFILASILIFSLVLLAFYLSLQALHKNYIELLIFFVFTLLIGLLYNSQNTLMWEIFNYSDFLPALNDWLFYIEDAFLPICGYLLISIIAKKGIPKKCYAFMCFHAGLYGVAAILQITWVISINYFRPVFMALTLLNYTTLFLTLKPWKATRVNKCYQLALFCIIAAHVADYLKYLLGFFPLQQKIVIWLNLEVPFLFFLPCASVIYMILLSYALMLITKGDLNDIQNKAERDMLTGLYNRSTMETIVSQYIESYMDAAGFIIIDIDDFKSINDTWGHLQGDEVLRKVAQELKFNFRDDNFVARLGGDEFAIFLPHLSDDRQIRKKVELVMDIFGSIEIGICNQKISGSVGFAIYPENGSTYEELYDNSDKAMYRVKKKQ